MLTELVLNKQQIETMHHHVLGCLPEEACGLLLGENGQVEQVALVTNALHSPTQYRMDAQEQLDWMIWLEENQKEMLGIFHSHPKGPPFPSETDIGSYAYPEAAMLIWAPRNGQWQMRVFAVADGRAREIPLRVVGA